jgi:uncharacterized iron-regulated protein
MKFVISLLLLLITTSEVYTQDKKPYQIYNIKGRQTSYKKMLKAAQKADIVFFGEQHNSAIAHWLQLELTTDLYSKRPLILGAEMFERDNQSAINQYVSKEINQKQLDTLARLWSNYKTDYKPLLDFAREKQLDFVATNIPRKYANMVFKQGLTALDQLSEEEYNWIVPLPFPFDPNLPTYQKILTMMGDHGTPELVLAQAIKDATMAYSIEQNLRSGHLFLHYNGTYHSDYFEGIVWYLKRTQPQLKYLVISTVTQKDIGSLEAEHLGKADFIIVVDEKVTKTY